MDNRQIMVVAVGAVLILGIMIVPMTTAQIQGQSKRLTCDTTKDCNIIIRRLSVGDDLIIQFKSTLPAGGGGGSTAPQAAVDQQARDDITNLKSVDVQHTTDIGALQKENQELKNQTQSLAQQNQVLRQNLSDVNLALITTSNAIIELQGAVKNITDANPFVNITIPEQNETGQGDQPTTPLENETGNPPITGENATTTPPIESPPGNITLPGNNETTTSPPAGNESNNNTTGPIVSNPICLPEQANCVTEPPVSINNSNVSIQNPICDEQHPCITTGESNVTLPIDNSSGNILIENATSNVTNDAK